MCGASADDSYHQNALVLPVPPSLQLDRAMLVSAPAQHLGEWVHPFCSQVITALPLNAQDTCCFCLPHRFGRSWLRVICAQEGCGITMHTACALRESARNNCELACTNQVVEQPTAGRSFGPARQVAIRCPQHRGAPEQWRNGLAHPCGPFDDGYPHARICAKIYCDRWTTTSEGGTCTQCNDRVCPACFLAEEDPPICTTCGQMKFNA